MGTLAALIVTLLVGGVATFYILGMRLRREEQATGILALAGMHWREFQRLVVAVMQRRGYRPVPHSAGIDDDALIELEHEGKAWLLSTKHGAAYVLGPPVIAEFANVLQLRGATGGWMTTLGSTTPDNVALARVQKIELLDGHTLWSDIKPLLDAEQRAEITGAARARAMRHLAVAWGLAVCVGGALFLMSGPASDPPLDDSTAPAVVSPSAQQAAAPAAAPRSSVARADIAVPPPPDDPQALVDRRRRLASAVSTLPWVDRAAWSTQSTLMIHLVGDTEADKAELCRLVEPYAELRASRLQLQPPQDSQKPVRFIQCRTY